MVPQKTEWMLALTFFLGTESRKPICSQLQHVYHLSYSRGIGGHQASRRFFWFSTSSYKSCMLRASKLTNIHHHKYLSESNKKIYIHTWNELPWQLSSFKQINKLEDWRTASQTPWFQLRPRGLEVLILWPFLLTLDEVFGQFLGP